MRALEAAEAMVATLTALCVGMTSAGFVIGGIAWAVRAGLGRT